MIYHSDNVSNGGSEIERLGSILMQLFIHKNNLLDANNDYMHFYRRLLNIHWLLVCHWVGRQWRVNNFYTHIFGKQTAASSYPSKVIVLAVFKGKRDSDTLFDQSWKWAWTKHQRFSVLWVWYTNRRHCRCNTWSKNWLPLRPKILVSTLLLALRSERLQSVNDFCSWILDIHTAVRRY